MATLTPGQLAKLRKVARRSGYDWGEIDFEKPDANAAFQAIEDDYQARKVAVSTLIDVASQHSFTNTEKKVMVASYYVLRASLDGGG